MSKEQEYQQEQDGPDYNQLSYTFQMLSAEALHDANNKYQSAFFYSSNEALGTLRAEFKDIEDILVKTHIVTGQALDEESLELRNKLLPELVQLSAMCMKTALTLCDMTEDAQRINHIMRQAQAISGALREVDGADN